MKPMTRLFPSWTGLALAVIVPLFLLAVPTSAQERGGSGPGAGRSRGGGSESSSGASSSGRSSGGGATSTASSGSSGGGGSFRGGSASGRNESGGGGRRDATGTDGRAVPRTAGIGHGSRTQDGVDPNPPAGGRSREGRTAIGTAVPRGSVPAPTGGTTVFIPGAFYGGLYPGGYGSYGDPWGYGGYGGYYGGYYDPWYGAYPSYGQSTYTSGGEGSLRLKIKPREAEVYVDGYYVGIVDNFDGIFQRLHVETGPHRIEVRAPGYESLTFEVRISSEHTTTYRGELKKIQ